MMVKLSEENPPTNSDLTKRLLLYKGDINAWTWILQRLSGIVIFFFLLVHVLTMAVMRLNLNTYNTVLDWYKKPFFQLAEFIVIVVVLYHALHGLRIIITSSWKISGRSEKLLFLIFTLLFILGIILIGSLMLNNLINTSQWETAY